jgi:hypothetical protein
VITNPDNGGYARDFCQYHGGELMRVRNFQEALYLDSFIAIPNIGVYVSKIIFFIFIIYP